MTRIGGKASGQAEDVGDRHAGRHLVHPGTTQVTSEGDQSRARFGLGTVGTEPRRAVTVDLAHPQQCLRVQHHSRADAMALAVAAAEDERRPLGHRTSRAAVGERDQGRLLRGHIAVRGLQHMQARRVQQRGRPRAAVRRVAHLRPPTASDQRGAHCKR
ncbi:hypothetical protein SDC9_209652 [bioreactor metagenome]|uniref:Uncharacterized protein n=1 Tax=bioreactor metagenome TaxID=1076179 RepID=A0A645JEK2_9ZZZZ